MVSSAACCTCSAPSSTGSVSWAAPPSSAPAQAPSAQLGQSARQPLPRRQLSSFGQLGSPSPQTLATALRLLCLCFLKLPSKTISATRSSLGNIYQRPWVSGGTGSDLHAADRPCAGQQLRDVRNKCNRSRGTRAKPHSSPPAAVFRRPAATSR